MYMKKNKKLSFRWLISTVLSLCMVIGLSSVSSVSAATTNTPNFYYGISLANYNDFTGETYIYLSTSRGLANSSFQSNKFADTSLDVQLQILGTPTKTYTYSANVGYSVKVIQKGAAGFDNCDGNVFYDSNTGIWHYWCVNGGVVDLKLYAYKVGSYAIDSNDLTIKAKAPNTDKYSYPKESVSVSVNLGNGKEITLDPRFYALEDNYVDKDNVDASIVVKTDILANSANITKELVFNNYATNSFDTSIGQGYTNQTNLDKYYPAQQAEITNAVNTAKEAIGKAQSQDQIDEIIKNLNISINQIKNKGQVDQDTANSWKTDYNDVISATYVNDSHIARINKAIAAYEELSPDSVKALCTTEYNDLQAKLKAATWDQSNGTIIDKKGPLTKEDLKSVDAALNTYDKLTEKVQGFVNPQVYNDLLAKQHASAFLNDNADILGKTPIAATDNESIDKAINDYNALTGVEKAYAGGESVLTALNNQKGAVEFLRNNPVLVKDPTTLTNSDLADLQAAVIAYQELDGAKQTYISDATKNLLASTGKVSSWLTDNSAIINKSPVTNADLTTINNALTAYSKLSATEQKLVDPTIITALIEKQKAANWYDEYVEVIEKETLTVVDLDTLLEANKDLDTDKAKHISQAVKDRLASAVATKGWNDDNEALINKATVTAADLADIEQALADYAALDKDSKDLVDQEVIADLQNKLETATMLTDNPILNTDLSDLTYEDLDDLKTAVKQYDELTNIQQKLIDDETKVKIEAAREALNWLSDNQTIIDQTIVDRTDVNKIEDALKLYESLSDEAKGLIDQSIIDDLMAKQNAADWAEKYDKIISKDPSEIEGADLADLREAMDAYNSLSVEEQALINTDIVKELINAQKDAFIKKYLSDKDGNMYLGVNAGNYEQILSGKTDWENMSQAEKDVINLVLKEKMNKTYEELIAQAKDLQNSAKGFVDKYLTGKDGIIYKEATKDNYKQILTGKTDWDKMSQDQKDAINAMLIANGGKTYEELLKMAQVIEAELEVKTGDDTNLLALSTLLAAGFAGVYLMLRKKEEFEI